MTFKEWMEVTRDTAISTVIVIFLTAMVMLIGFGMLAFLDVFIVGG